MAGSGWKGCSSSLLSALYTSPKEVFDKTYPVNPQNLGQKLKKARMDAGMLIKQLAGILRVSLYRGTLTIRRISTNKRFDVTLDRVESKGLY
jgi:hypothetical protein